MKKILLIICLLFIFPASVFATDMDDMNVPAGAVLMDGDFQVNLYTYPGWGFKQVMVNTGSGNYSANIPVQSTSFNTVIVRLYLGGVAAGDRIQWAFNLEVDPVPVSGSTATLGDPSLVRVRYSDGNTLTDLNILDDPYLKIDFVPTYVYNDSAYVQLEFQMARTGSLASVDVALNNSSLTVLQSAENAAGETNSLLGKILDGVTGMPGKIADLILGGIKDLFIPSDDWFEESFNEWDTYFEERLGVLYMPVLVAESVIYPLFQGEPLGSAGGLPFDTSGAESLSSGQILFPALSLPIAGETYQIWDAQVIDFAGMLNTYGLAWILDALKIIIGYIFICRFCSAICVVMFTTYFKDDLFFLTLASWFDRISFKSDKIVF